MMERVWPIKNLGMDNLQSLSGLIIHGLIFLNLFIDAY